VKLATSSGSIEVLDWRALTESAGAHPLFEGVRRITVTGLPVEPTSSDSNGIVSIRAPGLTADFRAAALRRADRTLFVTLEEAR
jgi:hypothetical protein